jgi:general secretion pathway protein D
MRGLNQKKGVDMLAKPAVITRSGQASSISMVREFIYATEYEPPELPNSTGITSGNITPVTPATPTAFETKDVGITMEVLPVVDENKQYVSVTLSPTFSDFDGFVNYGSPINTTVDGLLGPETATVTDNTILMPVFSKQSLSSTIDVADGSTVVIGGLMQDRVQNVEDKTPILGSLPILGRLFQSKASQSTSTAIIFFVNVELMDPTGRPYRER